MSYVYAILAPSIGIKIGYSTDPKRRLTNLNTASAVELELLMAVQGTLSHEAFLLEKLEPYRLRGEWFSLHENVFGLIEQIKSGDWGGFTAELKNSGKSNWQQDAEDAAEKIQRCDAALSDDRQPVDWVVWKYRYRPSEPLTADYLHLMKVLEAKADELAVAASEMKVFARERLTRLDSIQNDVADDLADQVEALADKLADRLAKRDER